MLREYFVGTSLSTIEMEFDAADISADLNHQPGVGGQRRTLVEQYYKTLDWTRSADAKKFLKVADSVMASLEASEQFSTSAEYARAEKARLLAALSSDGFKFEDGQFVPKNSPPAIALAPDPSNRLDAPELHRQLARIHASVESDPALALGTAKELVETACKTILEEHDREVNEDWDIGRLVKETREVLRLLPSDISEAAKGAESIKRVLSNLGAIAQGLGELRNLYGTGHGKSGKRRTIEPRHARLAAGAATALATFLLETHWDRTG